MTGLKVVGVQCTLAGEEKCCTQTGESRTSQYPDGSNSRLECWCYCCWSGRQFNKSFLGRLSLVGVHSVRGVTYTAAVLLLLVWPSVQRKDLTRLVGCWILTWLVLWFVGRLRLFSVQRRVGRSAGAGLSISSTKGIDQDSWRLKLYLDLFWVEMSFEFWADAVSADLYKVSMGVGNIRAAKRKDWHERFLQASFLWFVEPVNLISQTWYKGRQDFFLNRQLTKKLKLSFLSSFTSAAQSILTEHCSVTVEAWLMRKV